MRTCSHFSICITNRLTFVLSMTLQMGEKRQKKIIYIYNKCQNQAGWLMSAVSQEVFQHSCLGAVGQTDRGFPANTHRTLAGPDWKPDRLSFLPFKISSIAQDTLLLYVQGLVPQRQNTKARLISCHHFFSLNLYSSIVLTVFQSQTNKWPCLI